MLSAPPLWTAVPVALVVAFALGREPDATMPPPDSSGPSLIHVGRGDAEPGECLVEWAPALVERFGEVTLDGGGCERFTVRARESVFGHALLIDLGGMTHKGEATVIDFALVGTLIEGGFSSTAPIRFGPDCYREGPMPESVDCCCDGTWGDWTGDDVCRKCEGEP